MKAILIFSVILVFVSLWVSGNPKKDTFSDVISVNPPVRTFKPKSAVMHNENVNFKPALFTVTKATLGKMADLATYSLYFTGLIDINPGGNKFWNLASNAEIIDEIDNQIGIDAQPTSVFKDCNYYKKVFLSVLGQSITAHEYYYLDDGKIYAKGTSQTLYRKTLL